LLKGQKPSVSTSLYGKPFIATTPILVTPDKVQSVVDAGDAKASDICTGAVAAACTQYGVK
jgi:D-xylose transport system substrate-binding protein